MTYIYLVRSGGLLSPDAAPVAAFTKKPELAAWLRSKDRATRDLLRVYRMEDGGIGAVVEIGVDDIIEEGT